MPLSSHERDLIARTMVAEAGNEGDQGLAGVAAVIRNRATGNDPDFPRDVTGVIHQRNAITAWSNPRGRNNPNDFRSDDPQLQHAGQIADQVFSNDIPDPTGGATYYANVPLTKQLYGKTPPFFNYPQTAQIGGHTFFSPHPQSQAAPTNSAPTIASLLGPSPSDKRDEIGSLINSVIGKSPLDNE